MGSMSLVHWLILGVVLVLVLGGGRFSGMMGDVAKGIKQFKKGMAEDDDVVPGATRDPARIEATKPDAQKVAEPAFDRDGHRIDAQRVREDR
ncbi:twin-arginine translocase TatA/TatE family subunit [Sphingomonas bacterium]|uniref:twin-arginine translocase TatA/TatE family subunit n=1 Tax=Sphingomonas bacterium TaxID=1895847 RepID=UPI001576F931|nr:twin-arginine translocase TatA/TatE family subunit [Sphingomonas bacterium]